MRLWLQDGAPEAQPGFPARLIQAVGRGPCHLGSRGGWLLHSLRAAAGRRGLAAGATGAELQQSR